MAVVKMQKLGICAMTSRRGDILGTLQSMGVMQMEQGFDAHGMACPDTHDTAVQFNRYAAQLDSAVKVLSLYAPEGRRGLSLFEGKQSVTRTEFDRSKAEADELLDAGRDIVDREHDIREAQNAIGRDEVAQAALRPWMDLDVPFDYTGTRDMAFVAGTFQGDATAEEIAQELADGLGDNPPVEVRVLTCEAGLTYACVLYLRDVSEKVEENLRRLGFARPSSSLDGTPAELMAGHASDIERQHDRIDEAERKIVSYAPLRARLETCADYFRDRAARYELLASVPETKSTFSAPMRSRRKRAKKSAGTKTPPTWPKCRLLLP